MIDQRKQKWTSADIHGRLSSSSSIRCDIEPARAKGELRFRSPPCGCTVCAASAENALRTVDGGGLVVVPLCRLSVVEAVAVRVVLGDRALLDALVGLKDALVVNRAHLPAGDEDVLDEIAAGILDEPDVNRDVEDVHRVAVRQQLSEVRFNRKVVTVEPSLVVGLQNTRPKELGVQHGRPVGAIESLADRCIVLVAPKLEADVSCECLFHI